MARRDPILTLSCQSAQARNESRTIQEDVRGDKRHQMYSEQKREQPMALLNEPAFGRMLPAQHVTHSIALAFVLLNAVLSVFASVTYEGARSLYDL